MTRRERLAVSGVLLLGFALAFAAGARFGGQSHDEVSARAPHPTGAAVRNVYSPRVLSDPWFRERQRENVAALERHCRQTGQMCAEARQALLDADQ